MSQPNDFLCLRKRMSSFGYFDIHIKKNGDGYFVSACEHLAGLSSSVVTFIGGDRGLAKPRKR